MLNITKVSFLNDDDDDWSKNNVMVKHENAELHEMLHPTNGQCDKQEERCSHQIIFQIIDQRLSKWEVGLPWGTPNCFREGSVNDKDKLLH